MNFYSLTDQEILSELGSRVRGIRLRKNLTQQETAAATLLSLNTIKALEVGKGKLATFVAVLRELGALDQLDSLLPESTVRPLEAARRQGKQRQRGSGKRHKSKKSEGEVEW
jgi:putative transcriptional regulator